MLEQYWSVDQMTPAWNLVGTTPTGIVRHWYIICQSGNIYLYSEDKYLYRDNVISIEIIIISIQPCIVIYCIYIVLYLMYISYRIYHPILNGSCSSTMITSLQLRYKHQEVR